VESDLLRSPRGSFRRHYSRHRNPPEG